MSFIFGGNTPWSYDDIQRKRALAQSLAQGVGSPRNVGEGLSAIGKALAVRGIERRASRREGELKAESDSKWESIFNSLGGGAPMGQTYAAPSPEVKSRPLTGDPIIDGAGAAIDRANGFDDWNTRIRSVETGGEADPWAARGPVVQKGRYAGERAIGPNQIMPGNIPEWGAAAGVDPQFQDPDVLAAGIASGDPAARAAYDAIVENQYNQMASRGLNPTQMANVWFTGSPNPNPNVNDGYTSAATYASRFNGGRGGGRTSPGGQATLQAVAAAMNDPYIARDPGKMAILNAMLGQALTPPVQPKPTALQQNVEWLMAQGVPMQEAMQMARGGTQVTVNSGPDTTELDKTLSKREGDLWGTYLSAGNNAAGMQADMDALMQLAQIAPQGPLVGRLAEAFPGFSSAGSAFNAIVKRLAPTMRAEGSGSTSDIEYAGMLDSLPKLSNRPEANVAIAQMMQAKAQINMERAAVINSYRNQEISVQEARRRISEIDQKSIMTPELTALLAPQGEDAGGIPTFNAETGQWE